MSVILPDLFWRQGKLYIPLEVVQIGSVPKLFYDIQEFFPCLTLFTKILALPQFIFSLSQSHCFDYNMSSRQITDDYDVIDVDADEEILPFDEDERILDIDTAEQVDLSAPDVCLDDYDVFRVTINLDNVKEPPMTARDLDRLHVEEMKKEFLTNKYRSALGTLAVAPCSTSGK